MQKLFFREKRVQGTWRSGSESRCSISSTERFLVIDEKKRNRLKIGAIFKGVGKVLYKVAELIVAIGTIAGLIAFILKLFV